MTPERLADFLLQNPFPYCHPCLASKLNTTEHTTREAAELLLMTPGWVLERESCCECGTPVDALREIPF